MLALGFVSIVAALASAVSAAAPPTPPALTYLYSLNCTLSAPITIGAGPRGTRVAIPITGGTFSGPRISGTVLNLGADWGLTDSRGTFSADTRYQLRTNDSTPANIFIQTSGPAQANGKIHLRMLFETGDSRYFWLNDVVAVGVLTAGSGYVAIDGWYLEGGRK